MESNVSKLGFGCMRFPKKTTGGYDMVLTEKLVMHAIENGINYFDTAYIYPGNEEALGEVINKNKCREKIYIATKLQHFQIKKTQDFEKCFNEQLKRLKTDYVDYYLMHMLPDTEVWEKLKRLGVVEWLEAKKQSGQIKHVGFSYHGNTEIFKALIDSYDWEMCQIQYNYMDEHSQAGREGLLYAYEKGIPVMIMEPLRGGRLVNDLPAKAINLFEKAEPKRSPAEWALRWLWNQKEVSVVLSGMNSMDMLEENIRISNDVKVEEFTDAEFDLFDKVKDAINEKIKVPCTGCGYCMPCPFGVDIPGSFRCYNVSYTDSYFTGMKEYVMCTTLKVKRSNASLCQKCGKCEPHCPQGIKIRDDLNRVKRRFENPIFKVASLIIKKVYKV